jgi:DNA repair exonuclease SbcCD ATPase subunit
VDLPWDVARQARPHAVERRAMITDPKPPDTGAAAAQPAKSSHVWIWISAVLAVVAIGILVWALTVQSDLDGTQSDLDQANAQVAELEAGAEQTENVQDTAVVALKAAYEELTAQLGTATEDLATATADLQAAQSTSEQAAQAAAAAKEKAGEVKGSVEQAQATADQAQLEAEAARAKGAVIADCAKASFSVVGELLDGGSLSTVRDSVQSIAADCKTALAEG